MGYAFGKKKKKNVIKSFKGSEWFYFDPHELYFM